MLSIILNRRQLCDLELLANGAFKPLEGFMGQGDYECVLEEARLVDSTLWTIPIVLSVSEDTAKQIAHGDRLALRDAEGFMLASLCVTDLWRPDREREAEAIYGTLSRQHPGVRFLLEETQPIYVGGSIEIVELPIHYDFELLRYTTSELCQEFLTMGWDSVIALQTSKTVHRLERDLIIDLAKTKSSKVLLLPIVGETEPGNLEYFSRVKCCQAMLSHLPVNLATLCLLPLAMRMAGPRETLLNSIIHRNYGCSAFVVGPDDSSPPIIDSGERFYQQYESQEYLATYAEEVGIEMVPIEERRYSASREIFMPISVAESENEPTNNDYSEKDLRRALSAGEVTPDWFSFPNVIDCLSKVYPPISRVGYTLFFTGFSGSGKSTLARMIEAKLIEDDPRPVTLLDGDIVRQHLSSELGYSRSHRDLNIRRIGFVANQISKNGGVAICAPIAPYRIVRREVRSLIEQYGVFVEIHLSTPLFVCEGRDRKGLYAKARAGEIPDFTGVSDPYEIPEKAEIMIDTSTSTKADSCSAILSYLLARGLVQTGANRYK